MTDADRELARVKASALIQHFEGVRLKAYRDTGGIWTIGYGHTTSAHEGLSITQAEANAYLLADLREAQARAEAAVLGIELNVNEVATLISQAFNLRSFKQLAAHLRTSKALYKKKLLLYCHDADGHYLNGLAIRRMCERLLFEGRDWKGVALDLQAAKNLDYTLAKMKTIFIDEA